MKKDNVAQDNPISLEFVEGEFDFPITASMWVSNSTERELTDEIEYAKKRLFETIRNTLYRLGIPLMNGVYSTEYKDGILSMSWYRSKTRGVFEGYLEIRNNTDKVRKQKIQYAQMTDKNALMMADWVGGVVEAHPEEEGVPVVYGWFEDQEPLSDPGFTIFPGDYVIKTDRGIRFVKEEQFETIVAKNLVDRRVL